MNLILAQGAEHTNPVNLKKIIDIINNQHTFIDQGKFYDAQRKIYDIYGIECHTINTYDYSVEEKYDGYSYINYEGRFFSKRLSQAIGNEGQPIEKTGHLPYMRDILLRAYEMTGCDLHGELYIPGGISDDVTRILGCNEDEAINRLSNMAESKFPHFMLIDIRQAYGHNLTNVPHYIRRAILQYVYDNHIKPFDKHGFIKLTEELYGDPRQEFTRIVRNGGEGIIIKRSNALYIPGKKPANNWIKGKKKITYDVVIMGFNNGTGKNKSLFGSIEFGHYIDGKLTKCGNASSGLSDEIRQTIANNPDSYIGTVMEIEAIQESIKSFRNAVFLRLRDDKDATECTPINIRVKDQLL